MTLFIECIHTHSKEIQLKRERERERENKEICFLAKIALKGKILNSKTEPIVDEGVKRPHV